MELILKRILFAIFFAGLLFFSFHKSVAAENLTAIDEWVSKSHDLISVDCEKLSSDVRSYGQSLDRLSASSAEYYFMIANTYYRWHQIISIHESDTWSVPTRYFDSFLTSIHRLDAASSDLYILNEIFDLNLDKISVAVRQCLPDTEDKALLVSRLTDFQALNNEHVAIMADFVAQVKFRLEEMYKTWARHEGKIWEVPYGAFSDLMIDSKMCKEAQMLLSDSGARLLAEYNEIFDLLPTSP